MFLKKRHLAEIFKKRRNKQKYAEPPGTKNQQKALFPLDPLNSRCAGGGEGKNSQRVRHASHLKELHLPVGSKKSYLEPSTYFIVRFRFSPFQLLRSPMKVTCTAEGACNVDWRIWQQGEPSPRRVCPKTGRTPSSTDAPETHVVLMSHIGISLPPGEHI